MKQSKLIAGIKTLVSVLALAALAACGGGGGGSSSESSSGGDSSSGLPPLPAQDPIVVTTPEPEANLLAVAGVYSDANRASAFDRLNAIRLQAGLGVLRQVAAIDVAAQGHADWLSYNNYVSHVQVVGTYGFTGVTPGARNIAASYNFYSAEVISFGSATATGAAHVDALMAAPYHRLAMEGLHNHR